MSARRRFVNVGVKEDYYVVASSMSTKRFRHIVQQNLLRVLLLAFCMSLSACGYKGRYPLWAYQEHNAVADVTNLSQNPSTYLNSHAHTPMMTLAEQAVQFAALKTYHFAPWRQKKPSHSKKDAFWGVAAYPASTGYAENLLPWSKEAMATLVGRQDMEHYPSMAKHAITVRNSSLRVLPTSKPYFFNPALPGEGFPFDYFQNSSVHVGSPVFISHVSTSGKWVYAETAYASGWIPANDIAYVTTGQKKQFMSGTLHAFTRDNLPLKTQEGQYLSTGFVGGVFPAVLADKPTKAAVQSQRSEIIVAKAEVAIAYADEEKVRCVESAGGTPIHLLVPARNALGEAEFFTVPMACEHVSKIPATLTPRAMAEIAQHIIGQRYGWGGLYLDRDCSSSVRDLFMAFGVWLPRNSSSQASKGQEAINLKGLTAIDKRDLIIEKGIPFFSLIGMYGHIGIYLGYEPVTKMPIMLHDIWGVRTFNADREGRAIIGRVCITTLRPGEERPDVKKDYFYSRIHKLQIKPGSWITPQK